MKVEIRRDSTVSDSLDIGVRPFYFIVVFWGERFRNYLTRLCLPSLLSPNNIPSLSTEIRHRFLFCTTSEDWCELSKSKVFSYLNQYLDSVHIEIPPAPIGKVGCEHMGIGHTLASSIAFQDQAYGVFVTPDLVLSDGTVMALQKHAHAGKKVVLVSALRFGEEPLFHNMKIMGLIPEHDEPVGYPLVLGSRQMVRAGMESLHSETKRYEWESPYFANFPCACWWRVVGASGMVLHSLSWAPLLCDYKALKSHDTSTFERWTLDGDYIVKNFGEDLADKHVVTDSDEIMLLSWGPLSDRPQSLKPNLLKSLPIVGEWLKGGILRAAILSGIFDLLKQRLFLMSVRWHSEECTANWEATEAKAFKLLRSYLGDLSLLREKIGGECDDKLALKGFFVLPGWAKKLFFGPIVTIARFWMVVDELYQYRSRLLRRLGMAINGDREAQSRIFRRLRMTVRRILGIPIDLSE